MSTEYRVVLPASKTARLALVVLYCTVLSLLPVSTPQHERHNYGLGLNIPAVEYAQYGSAQGVLDLCSRSLLCSRL